MGTIVYRESSHRLWWGIAASCAAFVLALAIGLTSAPWWSTLSLIGTSIVLEAQPAAAASVALGFHPLTGALVSILGNLIPIPLLLISLDFILVRWHWARQKVRRAENWAKRYGRYGVLSLVFLSPFLGAYVAIGISSGMRWKLSTSLFAVLAGMTGSVLAIVYGGHWIIGLFVH